MVKALLKKADTIDHQLQILMAQARKCERDDLGRKQMIPEDEEQKQEWERNCEWVRLFVRSSLSSVDEETLNTMLADVRVFKSMCRTLHLMEGGYDLEPPPHHDSVDSIATNAAETVASAIDAFSNQSSADPRDHDELNARLGHGRSRSRSRAPSPSRARRPSRAREVELCADPVVDSREVRTDPASKVHVHELLTHRCTYCALSRSSSSRSRSRESPQ